MGKKTILALMLSATIFLGLVPKVNADALTILIKEPPKQTGGILPTENEREEQKKKSIVLTKDNIRNYSIKNVGDSKNINTTLPAVVDNSKSKYFPEIGDQGNVGSCGAFAATYYNMTFATAKANNWEVKSNGKNIDSKVFSPKWTYNFVGDMRDDGILYGSHIYSNFELLKLHGGLTLDKVPYDYNNYLNEMYNKSATNDNWKEATKYKVDQIINISFTTRNVNAGIPQDTIVLNPNDENLKVAKEFLSQGNILAITTDTYKWPYKLVDGEEHKGEYIFPTIYANPDLSAENNSTHAMSIVGYNDNIWYDFNRNGIAEDSEKGAFKVANSWGTTFRNEGFIWVSYDALNAKTSVPDNKEDQSQRGTAFMGCYAEGIVAKPMPTASEYEKQRLLQFTLEHPVSSEVQVLLGFKSNNMSTIIDDYYYQMLNNYQGKLKFPGDKTITSNAIKNTDKSFNGYNNNTGVFTFDLSVLEKKYGITLQDVDKYFLSFVDKDRNSKVLKVTDLKLTDGNGNVIKKSPLQLPLSIDGNFKTVEINNKEGLTTQPTTLEKPIVKFQSAYSEIYDFYSGELNVTVPKNSDAKVLKIYQDDVLIKTEFLYVPMDTEATYTHALGQNIPIGSHKYKAVLYNDTKSISSNTITVNRVGSYKGFLQTDSAVSTDGGYNLSFEVPNGSGITDWSLYEDDNKTQISSGKIDYSKVDLNTNKVKVTISGKSSVALLHTYKVRLSGMLVNGEYTNDVKIFNMDKLSELYNTTPSNPNYNKAGDINSDGIIDVFDLSAVSSGNVNKVNPIVSTLKAPIYYSDKSYYDLNLEFSDTKNILKKIELYNEEELMSSSVTLIHDNGVVRANIKGFDTRSLMHTYSVKITDIYGRVTWSNGVNIFDTDKVFSLNQTKSTSPNYNKDVDVNVDGIIDSKDVDIIKSWTN